MAVKVLDPNAPIEPVDSTPPPGGGPPNPRPAPAPGIAPATGRTTTTNVTPGQPPQPASGITQLPDGAGGAIPVPPPNMAGASGIAYAPRILNDPFGRPPTTAQPVGMPRPMTIPGAQPIGAPAPQMGATAKPIGAPVPQTALQAAAAANAGAGTPAAAGGPPATSQFGADSNLINTQINPTPDPRTASLQSEQDAQLGKILNGPDRNAMAQDQYNTWDAATAPDFEHSISDATDAAAAHGQIRSGQLTNRYGDLAQRRVLDERTARNQYMQQALEGSIGDTQRGFEDVAGAAGTAANQALTGREELRGERGYEQSQAQQALLNRIRQQQAEAQAEGQSFGEGTTAYGLGMEGDPTGVYQGASAQASDEAAAAAGDTGALLRLMALRRGQTAGNTAAA